MRCPICHHDNDPHTYSCAKCGARLPAGPDEKSPMARRHSEEHPGDRDTARRTEAIPASLSNLVVGSTFASRYRITQEIGRGGMGLVYKAEDERLRRVVALKFLPPALTWEASAKERFVHEAQAASSLDHPNICTIYEIDETEDGQMFIAMAFCEGEPLTKWIGRGAMAIDEALDIAIGTCAGLGAAHAAGIVHRDIKPGNIMLKDAKRARIVDFGLAKLAGEARLTTKGTVVGTAHYMSPEQARGEEVDARADIWAVGVVLYEMLTGKAPFRGDTQQAVIHSILHGDAEHVSRLRAGVPPALSKAVERCLKRSPDYRYRSAVELQAELEAIRDITGTRRMSATRRLAGLAPFDLSRLRPSSRKVAVALGSVAIAAVLLAVLPPGGPILTLQPAAPWFKLWFGPQPVPRERLVAILPFEAGGSTPDRALCDGLVAVCTGKLARVAALTDSFWVKSTHSVLSDSVRTPRRAREKLLANLAITGSVDFSADLITLRANLIDTKTERRLRTFTMSDPIANLPTWQEDLVRRVAGMLDEEVSARQVAMLRAGCTFVPAAYVPYLRGLGYISRVRPQADSAIAEFDRAIAEDSSFALAYVGMGEAYLKKHGNTKKKQSRWLDTASVWSHRATEINSLVPVGFILVGKVQLQMERLDEAAQAFGQAIKLDSTYFDAYNNLGYIYVIQKKYKEAEPALAVAADLRPKDFPSYANLGAAYYWLNRLDEDRQVLEKAMLIQPTAAVASNLGSCYVREQRYADADSVYRKARRLDPTDYQILGNHADACYWTPGRMDTAVVMFREAIRMADSCLAASPADLGVLADLASYRSMIGQRADAESLLGAVIRRDPSDPVLLGRIAETCEQLGRRDQAMVWLDRALAAGYPAGVVDTYPGWRNARSDEGFRKMLERYREN